MSNSLDLLVVEVAFVAGLDQVVHLAEQVHKQNGLVIQVLQPVYLLVVEVVHLVRGYYFVVVQVNDFEPILDAAKRGLVFFAEHEPDEVLVVHLVLFVALELARHLVEDSVHCFPGESVALVPGEVLFVYQKVVVSIQLPEPAVQDVEVLVREVLAD